jgi:integrase/recombinase XerD
MPSNPALTPAELREHVETWLASYRSAQTVASYRYDTDTFFAWLTTQGLQLHEVNRAAADRYRVWLETEAISTRTGKPLAPSTICRRLDGMSAFYFYMINEEVFVRNPFATVRRPPKSAQSNTLGLTVEEAAQLLKTADASDNPIEGALLWLFISTGLRLAEVHGANISSIHDGSFGMTISVRVKGDRPDRMGIPGPAADAMRRYLAVREECPTGALFTCEGRRVQRSYIRSILRRLCPKAGVPAITMHGLRHTCATLMLDTGASIGDVQAQLGHRHIATTLRYDRARRARADKAGNALTAALASFM